MKYAQNLIYMCMILLQIPYKFAAPPTDPLSYKDPPQSHTYSICITNIAICIKHIATLYNCI